MFVAGNTYPQSLEDIKQAAPAFLIGGTPSLAPHATWKLKTETIFDTKGSAIAEVIDGKIQITIPDGIAAVTSVVIGGKYYTKQQYSFDPITRILTIDV